MDVPERTRKAVAALHQARHEIAEVAARWEADGAVDTSPLVAPLLRIQQAMSELEANANRTGAPAPARKRVAKRR